MNSKCRALCKWARSADNPHQRQFIGLWNVKAKSAAANNTPKDDVRRYCRQAIRALISIYQYQSRLWTKLEFSELEVDQMTTNLMRSLGINK